LEQDNRRHGDCDSRKVDRLGRDTACRKAPIFGLIWLMAFCAGAASWTFSGLRQVHGEGAGAERWVVESRTPAVASELLAEAAMRLIA
jgi:hypothetical protein